MPIPVLALLLALGPSEPLWRPQESGTAAELRGIAVKDARHAWACGSGGTLLRTEDGETWKRLPLPGTEGLDFRDIEAPGGNLVVALSVGNGGSSRVYRSTDGGGTWTLAHTNPDPEGFYNAVAFWDERHGILFGDPVKGRFQVRLTQDGGATWESAPLEGMPEALPQEGAFAASGTCLTVCPGGQEAWFVTGGAKVSRVFRTADRGRTWRVSEAPVPAAKPSMGLFSIAFLDAARGFAAGGDYQQAQCVSLNGARTENGGRTWKPSPVAPSGFFSAVLTMPGRPNDLVAVGLAGTARSRDRGRTWTVCGTEPFNGAAFAKGGAGWAVGPKGRLCRYMGE